MNWSNRATGQIEPHAYKRIARLVEQGLLGSNLETVWACLDPDFNPADRKDMLDRFVGAYTQGFLDSVHWRDSQDPRAVVTEELQQHKAFCQACPD